MEVQSKENLLVRIEELEARLAEAEQLIEAIKAGEVDAFALNRNNKAEVFTLQSGDYAYRVLVENFSEGALNLSEDGLIVYTNSYFNELLNIPYDKVIGSSFIQFVHPASKEIFRELFKKGLAGQSKGEINLVAGKKVYPVYISLTSLYPTLPTVGMIVTDLTEKKQRLAEIERQKDFIETIVNSSPDLVAAYDTSLRLIAFNTACEETYKIKREAVIGKIYTDVFPAARGGQGEKDLLRALKGETIHNAAYRSSVNGRVYENFLSPLKDASGRIYAAVAIAHDITESIRATELIKYSEEKFNKLFAASPLGLVLSEIASGQIVDANATYFETIGYSRPECIGKTSIDLGLVDPFDRQKILDELHQKGVVKNTEVNIRTKSGKIIPVLNSIETISIGDKQYFLSAIIDISDRKNAEKKIEEKNQELQNMNKELEAFTYISSHDLQEPLRKIQTFAGRIIEKEIQNLSDTGKDYFNRMQDTASGMQALIQDLLNFSRLATTERKFEITDLNKIVEQVKEEFKEIIESQKAVVQATELCKVNIIPFQFHQLMHNLVSNALKFSKPDRPPLIVIKSVISKGSEFQNEKLLPDKHYCRISVSDNGIGFERRFSEKIFEVFQKLHRKEEFVGTGIGLAIVKKIVDNHQGIITAESELGKGATFNIYLPA